MLRYFYLLCFVALLLTGCVNYAGLHPHDTPYTTQSLAQPHSYSMTSNTKADDVQPTSSSWWLRFHDPALNQYMNIALSDSPNIDIAKARIDQASAQAKIANSALYPNANFDGYLNKERYTANSYIPPPWGGHWVNQGYIPINAYYDFDFWGKNRQRLAAATSVLQANTAELASARLLLSAQIATTYYQLRSYTSQLMLNNQLYAKQKLLLSIAEVRGSHGLTSDIPVNQAINNLQTAQINVENEQKLIELSEHQLATLMGKNPMSTTFQASPFVFIPGSVLLPQQLPAHLLAQRPDVIAARWQVEASSHDIKAAKAAFFPDINLTAYYSYQSIGLNVLFNQNSRDILIQPALSLPLFDGGLLRGNLSRRDAEYDENVSQYNQTLLTALRQVGDGLSKLDTLKQQLQAQDVTVTATNHSFALMQQQYQHGIIDDSQVLIAQTDLLNQELNQIQLQTAQMQAVIATIQALGGSTS